MKKTLFIITCLITTLFWVSFAKADCPTSESTPIGLANQGGYTFNYQSGRGKDCRRYLLRNTPGKVQTPVLWKDKSEVFLDVDIAECPPQSTCPWVEGIKISTQPTTKDVTTLSYGVNKDEYKDEPDAYRKKAAQGTKFPPLITIIRGIVGDAEKKPREIAIQVASYVEGEKPYRLIYVMENVGKPTPFQIFRSVPRDLPLSFVGFIWEAAGSKPFFDYLEERKIKELSGDRPRVVVDIRAREIELIDSRLLILVHGTKRIAATTAAAYSPRD